MALSKPTREQLEKYASAFTDSQTLKYFGVTMVFPDLETVEVRMDQVLPAHRGGLGSDAVNGGIISAIFDLVIGCTPALVDPTRRSATVQISISFLTALRGDSFVARGKVERGGGSLVFSSATIFDAQGKECAKATGMCRLSSMPWAADGTPAVN